MLFTAGELRNKALGKKPILESSSQVLNKSFASFNSAKTYDVFLSHSYNDADVILGLCYYIEEMGYSVYLDWINDPQMNRSLVTKETANVLRGRMRQSRSLIFASSENASESKWMPWELGYFDALKNKVGVLPILQYAPPNNRFVGQEYLGLYNYMVKEGTAFYVHRSETDRVTFHQWLNS